MKLRPYQQQIVDGVNAAWAEGVRNVLAVAPTGAGKTVIFSTVLRDHVGAACAIAHRQELVIQISNALNRNEVPHRIVGPDNVIRQAVREHVEDTGKSFFNPNAARAVAGVDTLVRRGASLERWLKSVTLWVQDEAHHVLRENKWGTAAAMFPNARGLGVTATPIRADGKGLGAHADGVFETMIEGPTMRWLIDQGYLTDYRIFCPPSDLDLSEVTTGADGDYSKPKLVSAVRQSRIVGDVVSHYKRIASGRLGVTFATDVETATDIAAQFNAAGVPAEVVSAKTPAADRVAIIRKFRRRELLQLVNVDLFGEGFDLPAIEVVSMARPTKSFALYAQQFGRALRILDGKETAIIIDHVGNVAEPDGHGLPDRNRVWSLDAREKRSSGPSDAIPMTVCAECLAAYERIFSACPYCGTKPVPAERSAPKFVDGDLCELDPAALAQMRGEIEQADASPKWHPSQVVQRTNAKRFEERQQAQQMLRDSIAWWAGYQRAAGRSDSESYRRFYFAFGTDVLSAQTLAARDAVLLAVKINDHLAKGA